MYRERVFSRRLLIFTEDQVCFECNNIHCWEALVFDLRLPAAESCLNSWNRHFERASDTMALELEGLIYTFRIARRYIYHSRATPLMLCVESCFRVFSTPQLPAGRIWGMRADRNRSQWAPNKEAQEPDETHDFPGYLESEFCSALCCCLSKLFRRREGFQS